MIKYLLIHRTVLSSSEIIVLIQHPVAVHSSVIDIGRYFSTYVTCRCGIVTVPTLEFDSSCILQ